MNSSKYTALLLLGLLIIGVTGGAWTPNQFIYKPSLGARGAVEKDAFDNGLGRIDNRFGKEIWVGDPAYGATLQSAITTIGSNQVILRVPPGTHSIAANLSIPSNVSLKVERGAVFSVATTKTLTINGGLDAGLYQIITCTGTGTVVFGDRIPKVHPQWFGAVGDNSTDDAAAINLAAGVARASACKRIAFPACTGYKATAQLDLTLLSIEAEAPINSSYVGTRVKCGGAGYTKVDVKLNLQGTTDWTSGVVGIQVDQSNDSIFELSSKGNNIGILWEAGAGSSCYNTITLRDISYNKIGFEVHVASGNTTGWTNDNLVFGGRFSNGATIGAECCIKLLGEGTFSIDTWKFIKPSFEIHDGTAAIITKKAATCNFQDVYMECGSTVPVALFDADSNRNIVTLFNVPNHPPYYWNITPTGNSAKGCDVRTSFDGPLHRLNRLLKNYCNQAVFSH